MGENKEYISHLDEKGNINISEEVIIALAADAAREADGVADLASSPGKDVMEMLGKKNILKGIKVRTEDEKLVIDVCILTKLGYSLTELGANVQNKVISAVESMTGFLVAAVNVHICGIVLNK